MCFAYSLTPSQPAAAMALNLDYFDFEPDDDLPLPDLPEDSPETLVPDVTDWLLPLALELLPEFFAVPVSSTLLLPPFLPPWVGLLIIVSLGLNSWFVAKG
jgi:hypothetical protein